jgi:hypothetical protein
LSSARGLGREDTAAGPTGSVNLRAVLVNEDEEEDAKIAAAMLALRGGMH